MPLTVQVVPLPSTPPAKVTPADVGNLLQRLEQGLQTIQKTDTLAQKISKIMQVLPNVNELAVLLVAISDILAAVASITTIFANLKVMFDDSGECICEALSCLNKIQNAAQVDRIVQVEMTRDSNRALLAIASNVLLGANMSRQGFALDDFGLGMDSLDWETTLPSQIDPVEVSAALGPCVPTQPNGTE